jgi:hypothetical protein
MSVDELESLAERRGAEPVPLDSLMSRRVRNILLISSLYDSFTMQSDGRFTEVLFTEYLKLNLSYAPSVVRVSTLEAATESLSTERFDLVISMLRVGSITADRMARTLKARHPGIPFVVLAHNPRDYEEFRDAGLLAEVDYSFIWQGDARLFLAVVKLVEDRLNARRDAELAGVKCILLVEDSPRFVSSYLPMLYSEIMKQTQSLMTEGVNRMQKLLRMRARPKILLADSFENAVDTIDNFRDNLLGAILDCRFPRNAHEDAQAGFKLAELMRSRLPGCPILFQSSETVNREGALALGAAFIDKNSPTLLTEVVSFLQGYLGFGDFRFTGNDGRIEAVAADLRGLERAVREVSDGALLRHAERDDFSTWLMARTEFDLARRLRPRRVQEFPSPSELRHYLAETLRDWRLGFRTGEVEEWHGETFNEDTDFVRIGGGSLGGKGRGLAFVHYLLGRYRIADRFPGLKIFVPPTIVIGTDCFDRFMEGLATGSIDLYSARPDQDARERDSAIRELFLGAELPAQVVESLELFLRQVSYPLAVRSSSLLEDSAAEPFAGVYDTFMLPNSHPDPAVRLHELCEAVRMVYASMFRSDSLGYMEFTPHRLEEEKMAVVIQQVVGGGHNGYLYPDVSGVAKSYNFYPVKGMEATDGVVSAALGFGRTVVDGEKCVRFNPRKPGVLYQFSSTRAFLENSQRDFFALSLNGPSPEAEYGLEKLPIETAEEHGVLSDLASVYSPQNDMIYDGIFREGPRIITMAGLLKTDALHFAEALGFLLSVGGTAFSTDIEFEFALTLKRAGGALTGELGFLQIRPMGYDPGDAAPVSLLEQRAFCVCESVLGMGVIRGIRDVILVPSGGFDRSNTRRAALHIERINRRLLTEGRKSILIGPGRWGSADHWLGIPVGWRQISTARCMVEVPFGDMDVTPSQGTHFFHNITSLGIGYFTITHSPPSRLDEDWLLGLPPEEDTGLVRHIRFRDPLTVRMDARAARGVILRPDDEEEPGDAAD